MNKHNDKKHTGRKGVMGTFLALLLIGATIMVVPVIMQDMELNRDAAEYEALREQTVVPSPDVQPTEMPVVNIDIPAETNAQPIPKTDAAEQPIEAVNPQATENPAAEPSAAPSQVPQEKAAPDLAALKVQNGDFIAWIQISGTNVDYPVVLTDDTEY